MRPRDLLHFLHRCIEVAINRGHERVTQDDIQHAEKGYSEDLLLNTSFEIGDTYPEFGGALFVCEGVSGDLSDEAVRDILGSTVPEGQVEQALDLLLWFGFLGVTQVAGEAKFSYQVRHNVQRLRALSERKGTAYSVHPGFRRALSIA